MQGLLDLIEEIEQGQYAKLLAFARKIRPNLTEEDLLQPNDYPELEHNPEFRHEEGVLEGVRTVKSAVRHHAR